MVVRQTAVTLRMSLEREDNFRPVQIGDHVYTLGGEVDSFLRRVLGFASAVCESQTAVFFLRVVVT